MADVFISHSSIDKAVADKLCEELEARGLKCWIAPRDIAAGSEWAAAISDAISETKVMLLIYSHHSSQSTQVPKEINLAESWGKIVIPYKIDDAQLEGVFAYFLAGAHWILANPAEEDYRIDELYADITDKMHTSTTPVQSGKIIVESTVAQKKKGSKALWGLVCGIGALIVVLLVVMIILLSGKAENDKEDDERPSKKQEELLTEETQESEITEEPEVTEYPEEYVATSVEDFEYTIEAGEAIITGYVGKEEHVVIPAEIDGAPVTVIGEEAFSSCIHLKEIVIPDSVTTIEKWAFESSGLTTISIPDSVTKVDMEAFLYCTNLKEVYLSANLEILEENLFFGCTSLSTIVLPKNLMIIEMGVFRETVLQSIVIPDSVTYIGEAAFYDCTELSQVTLPKNMTEIAPYLFRGCTKLTAVSIPKKVKIIGQAAFAHSGLTEVVVPDSVVFMEGSVFYACTDLEYAKLSVNLVYLPEYTFCECIRLNDISIGQGMEVIGEWAFSKTNFNGLNLGLFDIKEIGRGAFSECANLNMVLLPDTLVKISEGAFQYCPNLVNITIPDSVKGCAMSALYGNEEMKIIYGDVCYTLGEDGILSSELYGLLNATEDFEYTISGDGAMITKYMGKDTVVVIPEMLDGVCVTSIGEGAFAGQTGLEFVTMFHGVRIIGNNAFESCTNLKMADLSSELLSIGNYAFDKCYNLEYVELAGTLMEIGGFAFGETALKYVTIPSTVSVVNYAAFYGCTQMLGAYLEEGIQTIGSYAFGQTALENIMIPSTVAEIAPEAFSGCQKISIIYNYIRYSCRDGNWSEQYFGENSDEYI